MVVDILGFSQMITNLADYKQAQRIQDWITLVESTREQAAIEDIQLISDTLFAKPESTEGHGWTA